MTRERPARITVRVQPNAKRTEVVRFEEGILYLKIAAPPLKGKANAALLAFLSDTLGVSRSRLSIEKGATGRMKVIAVEGMRQKEMKGRIEDCLS